MPGSDQNREQSVRERAYFLWEREGRPEGRAHVHWTSATTADLGGAHGRDDEPMGDEEKIMAGRHDVNFPALLTKDVQGG
jgi:hypothetical protein